MVERMKNIQIKSRGLSIVILLVIFVIPCRSQSAAGCYTSGGTFKSCGSSWTETKDGVPYTCTCNCSITPPYDCTPTSSSSSGSSPGYSAQTQMVQSLLQPIVNDLVNNFNNWLNSGPSPAQIQRQELRAEKKEAEERKKKLEAYNAKLLELITKVQSTYKDTMAARAQALKEETVNDFKDRFAKSEAIKSVKQLNCAAFTSLQAAQIALNDFSDFKNLDGVAEQAKKEADFTTGNSDKCPEIKINIPDVTAAQPVSFQELFYNYIKHQSDSIKNTIDTLKVKKVKNDKDIEDKKQKVKEATQLVEKQKVVEKADTTNKEKDNQLANEALKELEAATNELQTAEDLDTKMKEEIDLKEKNILALKKLRGNYDIPKDETTPEQQLNK